MPSRSPRIEPSRPSRPLLGAARRWRVLGVVTLYAALAAGILFSTGTLDRTEGLGGLHLLPCLLAVAASLIFAPPPGERATPRHLLACLGLAAGVGVTVTLIAAVSPSRPWWLGQELLYAYRMLGLRRISLVALLVTAASSAGVVLPLLVVRQKSGELAWQVVGGLISGLAALLIVASDALIQPRLGLFGAVVPFGALGAGSFLADRWLGGGRPLGDRAFKPTLRVVAAVLLGALILSPLYLGLTGFVLRGTVPLRLEARLETALLDLQESLNTAHAREGAAYPSSLGEHPGIDRQLAAGLKLGYAIRYGRTKSGWALAADPVERPGEGWACYALTHDGVLRTDLQPFPLRSD